jgi:hypothetical protein
MAFGPRAESNTAPAAVVHSRIAPYILEASDMFVAIAPMELKASFRKLRRLGTDQVGVGT